MDVVAALKKTFEVREQLGPVSIPGITHIV